MLPPCHVADDVQGRLQRLVLARERAAAEELVALHLADHVLDAIPGALVHGVEPQLPPVL